MRFGPPSAIAMMSAMSSCAVHGPVTPATPVTTAMAAGLPAAPPHMLSSMSLSPTETTDMHAAGEQLYLQRCAMCHDAGRAPPRSKIAQLSYSEIREALDTGFMAAISQFMTPREKSLLVWHLSEKRLP
jgi:mono/diheme cytochrome c family protein